MAMSVTSVQKPVLLLGHDLVRHVPSQPALSFPTGVLSVRLGPPLSSTKPMQSGSSISKNADEVKEWINVQRNDCEAMLQRGQITSWQRIGVLGTGSLALPHD